MFLVLPSYIIQDLSFLQSALFVSGCPGEHPFCARGPFIPAGPPLLHWASVSIWCQNAVFSHCSTRHRHQVNSAPLGARVAQCPVACSDVGERPSSCCVRFCWEAVQSRVSWALVFYTWLFSAKVLSRYTFPYAGLGSEKWSNAKRHAGLRTLHVQWSYLLIWGWGSPKILRSADESQGLAECITPGPGEWGRCSYAHWSAPQMTQQVWYGAEHSIQHSTGQGPAVARMIRTARPLCDHTGPPAEPWTLSELQNGQAF